MFYKFFPVDGLGKIKSGDKTHIHVSSDVAFVARSDTNVQLRVTIGQSSIRFKTHEEEKTTRIPSILTIRCTGPKLRVLDDDNVEIFTTPRTASPVGSEVELSKDVDFNLKLDGDTEIYFVSEKSKIYINAAGIGGKEGGGYGAGLSGSERAKEHGENTGRSYAESFMRWKTDIFG